MSDTLERLTSRVDEIEAKGTSRPLHGGYGGRAGPFTKLVQSERHPSGDELLKVTKYNELLDPYTHLENFMSALARPVHPDTQSYHAF